MVTRHCADVTAFGVADDGEGEGEGDWPQNAKTPEEGEGDWAHLVHTP